MGMFSFNDKKQDARGETKEKETATTTDDERQAQVRAMSGFNSIEEVANSAKDFSRTAVASAREPRKEKSQRVTASQKEQIEAEAKRLKVEKAMEVVGKRIAQTLAKAPFDFWAYAASDPDMHLSPDEQKEFIENITLFFQSVDIDFSKPWMAAAGVVFYATYLVWIRVDILNKKKAAAAETAKIEPAPETVM